MNRLVIIGNGFDLAHGLKTSYMDFINWYWKQRILDFAVSTHSVSNDVLCNIRIHPNCGISNFYSYFHNIQNWKDESGLDLYKKLKSESGYFVINPSDFMSRICKSVETNGWVDIENIYYQVLKGDVRFINKTKVKDLNEQLNYLQKKLIEYLRTVGAATRKSPYIQIMTEAVRLNDISIEGKKLVCEDWKCDLRDNYINDSIREKLIPENVMLLSFNYTDTIRLYDNERIVYNYIHGELSKPENVIFGYGDELDKDYKLLEDKNENELLKYIKSVRYLETSRYREMLRFIDAAPFQVFIMGHSCGNSDRTLLNTIFEHDNCVSIKPFYHIKEDKTDNYLELVQNISRNFTDRKLFRDRVVNKELCELM